jgi:membrane associated rhomboid family serine protease
MIPIGDAVRSRHTPVMNWLLILTNVLVFLYELQLSRRALDGFILAWGVIPQSVLAAVSDPLAPNSLHAFETLITSQFIHGGWLHLLGNMLFLWIFGDNIEDVLGSWAYLMFYLFCGVTAGLAQVFVLSPFLGGRAIPSIGASGAIAGVLGAYLLLYPMARVSVIFPVLLFLIPFDLPAFVMIGWWFVQQFFYGLLSLSPAAAQSGGVAFWAHVGGFAAGIILLLPFMGRARKRSRWSI